MDVDAVRGGLRELFADRAVVVVEGRVEAERARQVADLGRRARVPMIRRAPGSRAVALVRPRVAGGEHPAPQRPSSGVFSSKPPSPPSISPRW
ncbi:hypothetical protein [Streptomyces sp. NPDC056491]|uniref:hypothetical protein n=1 Tax=Streptomyces sp. NPDC056491 TaxID=3345837 RepID=UPI003694BEC7